MAPFVTLLAALVATVSPLVQAVPVPQAMGTPKNCAAALILAQGISENIEDQKNEQAALAQVVDVLNQTPVDANAFAAAKANLLTFVNNGIAIRQSNQAIAPLGNKATAGLAIVADAQLDELNLSMGLTGDPAKDADAIKKLTDGFGNGLKQNEQNLADAMAGCEMNNGGMLANGTAGLDKNNGGNNLEDNKDAGAKDEGKGDAGKKDADKMDADKKDADKDADKKDADKKDAEKMDADKKGSGNEEADKKEANNESDKNAGDANAAQKDACN